MSRSAAMIVGAALLLQCFIPTLAVQLDDYYDNVQQQEQQQEQFGRSIYSLEADYGAAVAEIAADGAQLVIGILLAPIGVAQGIAGFVTGAKGAYDNVKDLLDEKKRKKSLTCEQNHKAFQIGKWVLGGLGLVLGAAAVIATGGAAAVIGGAALALGVGSFVAGAAEKVAYKAWCETYQIAYEKCLGGGKTKSNPDLSKRNIDKCLAFIKKEVEYDAKDATIDATPERDLARIVSNLATVDGKTRQKTSQEVNPMGMDLDAIRARAKAAMKKSA